MNLKEWIENPKVIYHQDWIKRWRQNPFSVPPIYIEISPVGWCNHRCVMCAPEMLGYPKYWLSADLLSQLLSEMHRMREEDPDGLGIRSIQYAGEGEPTLHKDLARIFRDTRKAGIDIGMLTNGTGLTEKLSREIIPLVNGYIQISINAGMPASYAKIHRAPLKHWDLIWRNLDRVIKIRRELGATECEIGANMTVLVKEAIDHQRGNTIVPANWREMETLVQKARDCGLDYVSFKPYSQHLYSEETAKLYGDMSYKDIISEIFEIERNLIKLYSSSSFKVVLRSSRFKDYESKERGYTICRATPNIWSYIQSDGTWLSCSAFWTDERFHLGNIKNQSFKEIWYGERRKAHLKYVLEKLDITECRKTCHPDKENRFLDSIANLSDIEFDRMVLKLGDIPTAKRSNFI